METVTSADGTIIAFERSGAGPVVIMVAAALALRGGTDHLNKLLGEHLTVIDYDRRGRGNSTDSQPYAVQREVEDIEALIACAGGAAYLFGSSSGAVLALEAASRLGSKVNKLFLYEPPFIIENSQPPVPDGLGDKIGELVRAGQRGAAVTLFFTEAMGIPSEFVAAMRRDMPGWPAMEGVAHTLPYDLAVLAGTQVGEPLPVARWASATAQTLVMVGERSAPFFHNGARALVDLLPEARYRVLPGQDHSAVHMAPKQIAAAMMAFFQA